MKIRFKQEDNNNCGLMAVSNAVNDGFILKEQRIKDGTKGQTLYILNNYLREDGKHYHIETLYKSLWINKLPAYVEAFPQDENQILPLLLNVRFSKNGSCHLVALRSFSDKSVQVHDSLRDEVIILEDFSSLNKLYFEIFGLYAFCDNNPEVDGYIMLSFR